MSLLQEFKIGFELKDGRTTQGQNHFSYFHKPRLAFGAVIGVDL
jgi:hypothetical protein